MEFYDFPYIGNVIIPTDEVIFFRGVGIPPTRFSSAQTVRLPEGTTSRRSGNVNDFCGRTSLKLGICMEHVIKDSDGEG